MGFLKRLGLRKVDRARRQRTAAWKARRALFLKSGLFDPDWYRDRNPDVRQINRDPLDHFAEHGANEWRDPGPNFDSAFYAEENPSFAASGLSPFEHYLRIGRPAGQSAFGLSPYARWVQRFDTLASHEREWIEADILARPLPAIAAIHLPGIARESEPAIRAALADQIGARVTVRVVTEPGQLAGATDLVASLPDGAIVILTAGEARLRPHAAYAFARSLSEGSTEAAYSDHDHIDAAGQRHSPVFKPAMSPDFMAQCPYAGPVVALRLCPGNRASLANALAAATAQGSSADPAPAFAALLRGIDHRRVGRVPLCLYALASEQTATHSTARPAYEVVPDDRTPLPAPATAELPQVRILIPTRDRRELLEPCVASILEKTDYPRDRYRIVVIDNDTRDPDSLAYLEGLSGHPHCAVVRSPGPFNFAKICNDGAAATDGDILVFLNNDMTVIEPGWLAILATQAARPEIGAVGAKLLYPDDTVQHGGVVLGVQGVGAHRLVRLPASDTAARDATREMTSVTGACLAVRRSAFDEIGGFDPVLSVAFNDARLCMQLFEAGYRNLYVAQALLYHHESKSRGFDDSSERQAIFRREAIYVRTRHASLFRDDPSYSPNLSLQTVGDLGMPPRIVPPWRRSARQKRVLLLSVAHGIGHGVGCVVGVQAASFLSRGWDVTVGGPIGKQDRPYPGCKRVALATEAQAAAYAVAEGMDCVMAHTPPYFSVARYLGSRPLFYCFDHGEPPAHLFEDHVSRRAIDWEKRFCAPLARRVFVISQAIYDEQYRSDAEILRNGNTHLADWTADWARRRPDIRRALGLDGRCVILSVCRFHAGERRYKGIDQFIELAAEARYAVPALADKAVFAVAGRGDDTDIAHLRKAGLTVFPNVTDAEMAELYAASDLYVSLSQWEGYNLGIGQALAMGLPAIGSDIPAHREFGIPTAGTVPKLCALLGGAFAAWDETASARTARLEPWDRPLSRLVDRLEEDLAADAAGPWL